MKCRHCGKEQNLNQAERSAIVVNGMREARARGKRIGKQPDLKLRELAFGLEQRGLSVREIADQLGRHPQTVRTALQAREREMSR